MAFKTLNYDEQHTQLNTLAQRAALHFGFSGDAVALMHYTNNAVYTVTRGEAPVAVMRVHRPGNRPTAQIQAELAWLKAIRTQTALIVPEPLGDVFEGTLDDEPTQVVMFGWIDGERIAPTDLTADHAERMGRFIATLHRFSEGFSLPEGMSRPALDWEGLFGGRSPYRSDAETELINADQRLIMQKVADKVRETMTTIGQTASQYGMIHGDLIAKNWLFDGEQIAALDFDDCAIGYYLYDLSPFLWGIRAEPHYATLREALWQGYTAIRPQATATAAHVEAFIAARHVASCRWIAGNRHNPAIQGRAAQIIATRVEEMRHYLATGRMGGDV